MDRQGTEKGVWVKMGENSVWVKWVRREMSEWVKMGEKGNG